MANKPTAAAHRRTRKDHASETTEDYVEAIAEIVAAGKPCRVTDLASRFGVSHVTVIQIIRRLEQAGFVTTAPYQPVELTPLGRDLAARCKQRHAIVYDFLIAIGVSERVAAIDSEGIEHHVSPETLERFEQFTRDHGTR